MTAVEPVICRITTDSLSAEEHVAAVDRAASGASVMFAGIVRDHDHGRSVVELEYVGYPTADAVLRGCLAEIAAEPLVNAVAGSHRLGRLEIGDAALVVAVSAAHRGEAFAACARLVDLVKERLPVWKRQVFADGTEEWVNCP
jgi:molybdopterin synthase catalytic subunit